MSDLPVDRQAKALIKLYKEAEARLTTTIIQAHASGALGTEANRQRQLLIVQRYLVELQKRAVPIAAQVVAQGYREGLVIADGAFVGNFNSIHQEATNVLMQNMVQRLNDASRTVGRRVEDLFRKEALTQSAINLIQSGRRREATDEMQAALERQGKTAFIDSAGRDWGLARYTAMAVRTTTREATTQATLNRFTEHGTDLVSISTVALTCDICKEFDGNTYSLSGEDDRYPQIVTFPPFHPNCRHTLLPASTELEDFEQAVKRAKNLDDLEKILG